MLRKSIITATVLIATCGAAFAAVEDFKIRGHVKAEVTKADLTDAWVYMLDKDLNPADSVQANKGFRWTGSGTERMSDFYFTVPRCDSTYVMRVSCPGFSDKMVSFEVRNVGKRESWRQIPVTFLKRAPRELGEVTVTATKIKFYNRGDTIVYNADAFELAEGSMLDALVAQLPGVELHEGGVIKVNGEQVESLLLNGKEFFNKDNELMLENIGAYTVKNIEVYKGRTTEEKFLGKTDTRHLTMDVKLKREYNTGLVANAQAGYGTEDRYMGRLFGMWFTPTNRLTLIGNINNLNDTRKPGQNDSWSPDKLPSGTKKFRQVGIDHQYNSASSEIMSMSDVIFKWHGEDNRNTLERTNFLTGGNSLDFSQSIQNLKSAIVCLQPMACFP